MRAPLRVDQLGRLCVILYLGSAMFPIAASVRTAQPVPRWLGVADVSVAVLLVVAAVGLVTLTKTRVTDADKLTAFRASQTLSSVIPVLLAIFFIVGNRISWDILVIGLAWRSWLFLHTLPCLIAAERAVPRQRADTA